MRFCMIETSGIGFGGLHGKNRLSGGDFDTESGIHEAFQRIFAAR